MQNIIITGQPGSGKSSISAGLLHAVASDRIRITFSPTDLPTYDKIEGAPANAVIVFDDCGSAAVGNAEGAALRKYFEAGGRAVCECLQIADLDESLFNMMCRYGGFRHVDIGLNQVLANPPEFRSNMAVEMWDALIENNLPIGNIERSALTVLGELTQAIDSLAVPGPDKAQLYLKIAILANAVRHTRLSDRGMPPSARRSRKAALPVVVQN